MKHIHLGLDLSTIPPVFRRHRHALILVGDDHDQFWLSTKKHYPAGIARLLGGGLEENEDPHVGAARELAEETGITVDLSKLHALAEVQADFTIEEEAVTFTTYLYFYQLGQQHLTANDDVDAIVSLSMTEYKALIDLYHQLSPEVDPGKNFAWADYGKLYGPIHKIALTEALPLLQKGYDK